MFSEHSDVKIVGVAAAVSSKWDSLRELSKESEAVINKFIKTTGVEGRYSASPNQCASDFCFAAAEKLLTGKKIDRNEIGILVYVTQTADYRNPSTACVLQDRLGLSENVIAFDVNLGCSGFVYGLNILSALLEASEAKYGLLLAGDTSAREFSTKHVTKTDHTGSLLFGDSGTATLVEKAAADVMQFLLNTRGSGFRAIVSPYGFWRHPDAPASQGVSSSMDEIAVFNFATNDAPSQINDYMLRTKTTPDDYDCLVLHQANLMIMKRIAKKTGFPMEKVPISMDRFGNTSSSSIPLTLVDQYGDREDDKVVNALCCGFGVGLSWATVSFPVHVRDIYPLVHTDDYYVDGYTPDDGL